VHKLVDYDLAVDARLLRFHCHEKTKSIDARTGATGFVGAN
jgi:hypothetical protein